MKTQTLQYSDGRKNFVGYLAWDETRPDPRPGVIVFPEAFGLGEHARDKANQLARLGYVALAADPHGDGKLYTDLPSVVPAIQALYANRAEWRGLAQAAFDALVAQPLVDRTRIGAIGFCFGGTTCLELARTGADVGAVVTFHSGLNTGLPEDAGRIRSKVLVCHASEDPLVKPDAIEAFMTEMRRDKVDWQLLYLGNTVHSFTEPAADGRGQPASFSYSKKANDRAWAAMRYLFDETFAG